MTEKALFPMKNVSISQRAFSTGSHKSLQAIDINGKDTGIEHGRAPSYIKVLAVLEKSKTGFNNTVLYGTCDASGAKKAVLCADNIERILTFAFTHDNNISDIKVGQIFKQGEICYQEGTTGQATGNHIHVEIGEGWQYKKYKDANGNWCLKNLVPAENVFWLLEEYNEIVNRGTNGYDFRWTNSGEVKVAETIIKPQEEKTTMRMKCVKALSAPNKYPTKNSYNGLLNAAANSFILVGDIIAISDIKADIRLNISCKIDYIERDGMKVNSLNNKWFNYNKDYFK